MLNNEKQLAEYFRNDINQAKKELNNFSCTYIKNFSKDYKNINFKGFQKECENLGFHAKLGKDIKFTTKYYTNMPNYENFVFIFEADESNL
jgi:hypothetical protein